MMGELDFKMDLPKLKHFDLDAYLVTLKEAETRKGNDLRNIGQIFQIISQDDRFFEILSNEGIVFGDYVPSIDKYLSHTFVTSYHRYFLDQEKNLFDQYCRLGRVVYVAGIDTSRSTKLTSYYDVMHDDSSELGYLDQVVRLIGQDPIVGSRLLFRYEYSTSRVSGLPSCILGKLSIENTLTGDLVKILEGDQR